MIEIKRATSEDVKDLVNLGARLFKEDAGVYDTYIDLTWSDREGAADFRHLLANEESLVLIARAEGEAIGHLVGYASAASQTRKPVRFAVLRSMYIDPSHRRGGIGRGFVDRFVSWAKGQDCVEAHVSSYVDNHAAQLFYETMGFESRSLTRSLSL